MHQLVRSDSVEWERTDGYITRNGNVSKFYEVKNDSERI